EIGAQVSSGAGDRVDQEGPDLLGEVEQLLGGQPFEVGWPGDGAKQTHDASAPFLRGRDHRVYDQPPSGAVWPTGSSPGGHLPLTCESAPAPASPPTAARRCAGRRATVTPPGSASRARR